MYAQGIGHTDLGKVRQNNEDAFIVDNDAGLYIVCDGMGGHAAGDVASKLAVEEVSRRIARHRDLIERARAGDCDQADVLAVAEQAVIEASQVVYDQARSDRKLAGMGSTLTLLLVLRDKMIMAHVGDTRLYLIRGAEVHQLSVDHTIANELVRQGSFTLEEASNSSFAHVLSRAIGTQPSVQVDTLLIDILPGDTFIMCTDGLSNNLVSPTDLLGHAGGEFEKAPSRLVDFANASGGLDNITVVAVRVDPDEADHEAMVEHDDEVHAKIDVMGSNFMFEDLTLAQLTRVLEICEIRSYAADERLVEEGTSCSGMFVVLDGRVEVTSAGRSFGIVSKGDLVGETTLLEKRTARATLTAVEQSLVLRMEGGAFRALVQRRPFLGVALLAQLGQRLGRVIDRTHELMNEVSPEVCSSILKPPDMF